MPGLHTRVTVWKYCVSSHPLLSPMPALSIRKLTWPKSISTFARRSLHSSILLTSIAYVRVSLPLLRCERASDRASVFRSTRASFIPCLWQSLATAKPMPEAAPVIRAELPALKTGCKDMFGKWEHFNGFGGFGEFGLVGLKLCQVFQTKGPPLNFVIITTFSSLLPKKTHCRVQR